MDRAQLVDLIATRAAADAAFADLVKSGDNKAIAAALSVGRTRPVSRLITERGVISALGPVEGEAALQALEAFAVATLPDGHSLKAMHAGIARTLSWLKPPADGIDIGDPLTRQLLSTFGGLGVLKPQAVAALLALASVPDPISHGDVSIALSVEA